MFKELTHFSLTRTRKEAIGFYLAWLLAELLAGACIGLVLGIALQQGTTHAGFELGLKVGTIMAIVVSIAIAILVAKEKGIITNFKSIILIILTGILAAIGGGLLGLIIPAYLTTRAGAHEAVEPIAEAS